MVPRASVAAVVVAALAAAHVGRRQWAARGVDVACAAAAHELRRVHGLWAEDPADAAEALADAFAQSLSDAEARAVAGAAIGPSYTRCCAASDAPGCVRLEAAAAPTVAFLRSLRTTAARRERAAAARAGAAPRVVVVGGGPSGLSGAIEAHAAGAEVTVVEKRAAYARQVWFDLAPDADGGGGAQSALRALGFFELEPRVVADEGGSGVITVQCHTLERFLATCCRLLSIRIIVGRPFVSVCVDVADMVAVLGGAEPSAEKSDTPPPLQAADPLRATECAGAPASLPRFDVLVGADGPGSAVRSALRIAAEPARSFRLANGVNRTLDELSQVTLVLALAPNSSGACPQPARERSGAAVSPHAPSFGEPGVSTVFKRLYEPYCELQVLFEEETGAALLADFTRHMPAGVPGRRSARSVSAEAETDAVDDDAYSAALPLELLARIARTALARPFADGAEVLRALRRPSAGAPPDAALFRVRVLRAASAGRVIVGDGDHRPAALGLLRGDALVSAHYRLGIGVNQAFATLPHIAPLIRRLGEFGEFRPDAPGLADVLRAWEDGVGGAASAQASTQLAHIYFEAICGLLVLGGRVYRRRLRDRSLEELPLDAIRDLRCTPSATAASRASGLR